MRIMQIASGDLWAGAEVQVFNLAANLAQREGVEVLAVLMNHGELERRLRERGVAVEVLDENRLGSVTLFRRLVRRIREWRPDVVHTHRVKENVLGGVAAFVNRVPSIRTVHGRPESGVGRWDLRRQAMKQVDYLAGRYVQQRVIAVSDDLGDELTARYEQPRVAVIYNGIELPPGTSRLPQGSCIKAPSHVVNVAVVARLVPVKRIDLVIDIAEVLHARHAQKYHFTIYGDGPLSEPLAADVEARSLGRAVTLAGFCPDVVHRLRQHDAMLITSDHEGLPTNLLEAMSLGVPVIARSVGAIPAVLGGGDFGTLVTDTTDSRIVQAMARHLEQLDQTWPLASNAVARAGDYSASKTAETYSALYRLLVPQRQAAGTAASR